MPVVLRLFARRRFGRAFPGLGVKALSIAFCCWRIAFTAALVHRPAARFAQLRIMLLGLPFMPPPLSR